jgi:hypothetical protein
MTNFLGEALGDVQKKGPPKSGQMVAGEKRIMPRWEN